MLLLGTLVLFALSVRPSLQKQILPVLKPILMFMSIGCALLAYSIVHKGIADVLAHFRLFALGVMGIGSAIAFRDEKDLRRFILFILIIWSVEVLYSYFDRFSFGGFLTLGKAFYINRLLQPFGAMLAFGILLTKPKNIGFSLVLIFILVVFSMNTLLDLTRATWLYLLVSLGLFFYLHGLKLRFVLTASAIAFLMSTVLSSELIHILFKETSDIISISGSAYTRWISWQILFQRWLEHPLLGHGLGATGAGIDLVIKQYTGDKGTFIGTAHNAHLILLYYIGIVGVASYLFLTTAIVRKALKSRAISSEIKILCMVVIAGLAGFIVQTFTQPLSIGFHYYFWFYLSLLAAVISINRRQQFDKSLAVA